MAKNLEIGRNWTFVLYPDSMDPDYRNILDKLHIQWCESPLHNMDVDPDGVIKKEHIHIVLSFEGNKSYDQIKEICDSVHGCCPPLYECRVASIRGIVRYLIHLDNPEKYQYERSAIIVHGGMDIDSYFQYAGEMVKRYIQEMIAYCNANSIYEMSDLIDYAAMEKYNTWYDLLTIGRQGWFMSTYLDSKRNKEKLKYMKEINNAKHKCNDRNE